MKRRKKGTYFMGTGLLLIAAAFLLLGYNLWDEHRVRLTVQDTLDRMWEEVGQTQESISAQGEMVIPDYILNPEMDMPPIEIDGEEYIGILDIPMLGLSLPIMGQWSYAGLKNAPCRYTGSIYTGDMVIAAHNYQTHFGGLKNLPLGAEIIFTDVEGAQFVYQVAAFEVLAPTAVDEMTQSDWDLTLFTCTYGGQTRFTVRCREAS